MATERRVIILVFAVQLINLIDFMMVLPLGPFFAADLDIPTNLVGVVAAGYSAAAVVGGLVGALFLDRSGRRIALTICLLGLAIGTILGGFATDLYTLMGARVVAGLFGGPATSIALAIVADTIPPERRGNAMGKVMGAFAIASIGGVPASLFLAGQLGWQAPFFALGAFALLVVLGVMLLLPPMQDHLKADQDKPKTPQAKTALFTRPIVWVSMIAVGSNMGAAFALVPNFATYFVFNLEYPELRISLLYLFGGAVAFFTMRMAGKLSDKQGASMTAWLGTILMTVALVPLIYTQLLFSIEVMFMCFMGAMSFRNVSARTLTSKVPMPNERARFMSGISVTQHLASTLGALASAQILVSNADGRLERFDVLVIVALACMFILPVLLKYIETAMDKTVVSAAKAGSS